MSEHGLFEGWCWGSSSGWGGEALRNSFSVIGSPVFKVFIFAETEINIVSLETFD